MKEHRFITFERIIKNGVVNFGRNIWLALAAIAMMSITLTILLFAVVANATFSHTVDGLTSHIDVSVFLKDGVTDKQKDQLISEFRALPSVEAVSYTSKDQALKTYEKQNANNTALLSAISETSNPLPASLEIKPVDPNNLQPIRDFANQAKIKALETATNNDTSKDREDAINNITRATKFFEEAGIVGIAVFVVISILIIFNTIRMTIFNRRDELVIMRLLGASPGYIRGPFIVETMIYGAVAAGISLAICATLFAISNQTLHASTFGLLDITYAGHFFRTNLWAILGGQILAGIIIGAASSALATRRYLKSK